MLFAGLGSVRMVKNCDLGRENAALGPVKVFHHTDTDHPAGK